MEITFAVLADYASVSADGKLSVMGIWNQISPVSLPAQVLTPYLVLTLVADVSESGRNRTLKLVLLDADGKQLMSAEHQIVVPVPPRPGASPRMNTILRIPVLQFPTAGDYRFALHVDNDYKAEVLLTVNPPLGGKDESGEE